MQLLQALDHCRPGFFAQEAVTQPTTGTHSLCRKVRSDGETQEVLDFLFYFYFTAWIKPLRSRRRIECCSAF